MARFCFFRRTENVIHQFVQMKAVCMYACLRYSSHIESGEIETRLCNDNGKV